MQPSSSRSPRPITPRKMRLPFDAERIPKYWYAGSPLITQINNGVSLLFPAGERFFVRSVKRFMDRVQDDPELVSQIRGFFGQEGKHAREHERHAEMLEEQGYEIRAFLEEFERTLKWLENRFSPEMALASTAAGEHYTAIMAEGAFTDPFFLNTTDPVMRKLMQWHAAEEVEHKSVAFDVLQRVAPNYLLRVTGMAAATVFLIYWWQRATRMLLKQDGFDRAAAKEELARIRALRAEIGAQERGILREVFLRGLREYIRPDFHPWDNDNLGLVDAYLNELDAQDAVETAA